MSTKTTILLCGATGKQGAAAINTLFDDPSSNNLSIRFLTRNPDSASAQKLVKRGAVACKGDLSDAASLSRALQGVDRAYLVTPAHAGGHEDVQGKTFIDAAKQAGVKHIVMSSVAGADKAVYVPHFHAKWLVEQHLHTSGIPYTILRPAGFMDNFPTEPGFKRFAIVGTFFAAAGWKSCKLVACEDIGIFVGKALLKPSDPVFLNQTITLAGGDYTMKDIRAAYTKIQGRQPWFANWCPTSIVHIFPYDFKQMMLYFRNEGFPPVDFALLKQINPKMQTYEDYIRANELDSKRS